MNILFISYLSLNQVKDAVPVIYSSYDGEYTYTLVQDALGANNKSKLRQRREKGRPCK